MSWRMSINAKLCNITSENSFPSLYLANAALGTILAIPSITRCLSVGPKWLHLLTVMFMRRVFWVCQCVNLVNWSLVTDAHVLMVVSGTTIAYKSLSHLQKSA